MAISLGEILEWDILDEAKIITDSFDKKTVVENITIMEAPDIGQWIDGKNIVLTSLFSIYGDKRKIAEFIDSLGQGRICALFVKTHRFVDEVPFDITMACQRMGIAVVEIPSHLRYIDIMYPVIAAIFDSRIVQLSYYKQTLNALTGPALGNQGIQSIAQVFSGIVKNPVVLYDDEKRCLYATDSAFGRAEQSRPVEEGTAGDLDYTVHQVVFKGGAESYRQLVIPIRVFGQTKAYLAIVEKQHSMTEMDFVALENAVTVLSFELVKDFAEEEVESRFKQEIVADIVQRRNLDSVKDRLSNIGLHANAKYNVLIIEMPHNSITRTPAIVKQQLVSHHEVKLYDLFLDVKKKMHLSGFESHQANTITAFLEKPDAQDLVCANLLETLCKTFLERSAQAFPDFGLNIGYTTSFRDIIETAELYKNAQDALRVSRILYGENHCCNYDKLGIYKILCLAREKSELESYLPASLKALERYQNDSGLPLLETLACYFENNGNVQKTAKAMFVHYKTLQYRMNKIENVAGISLKNSADTLELQMGLNIQRMMKEA